MLYRAEVTESSSGAEAVVYLDTASPKAAERWLQSFGFAVGDVTPGTLPTHAPSPNVAPAPDPNLKRIASELGSIETSMRKLLQARFVRAPIWTIGWGIVCSVLCMLIVNVVILAIVATSLLPALYVHFEQEIWARQQQRQQQQSPP